MLEAIIFDFDGVVVDSEPLHMAGFQQVLKDRYGIELEREEYYDRYLAFTDLEAFEQILTDHGRRFDEQTIAELIEQKTALMHELLEAGAEALPGVVDLMRSARAAGLAVGICSGALRGEIELAAGAVGALPYVQRIVSAEDVDAGKPHPQGYRLARRQLAELTGRELPPEHCVAVEDAPAGIVAAKAAGLRVLAVTTSMGRDALSRADRIVSSLESVTLDDLRAIAG